MDGSAVTTVCTATLRQKLQITLAVSSSRRKLTPVQQVPALTLSCQTPGRTAIHLLVPGMTRPGNSPHGEAGFDPVSATLKAGRHLTSTPLVRLLVGCLTSSVATLSSLGPVSWKPTTIK